MNKTSGVEVTQSAPCPVCQAIRGCSFRDNGAIFCRNRDRESCPEGFTHLHTSQSDSQWNVFRWENDPRLYQNQPGVESLPAPTNPKSNNDNDWATKADQFSKLLTPENRRELSEHLGLPDFALKTVRIGWKPDERCWTWPEVDARGRTVGVTRRFRDPNDQFKIRSGDKRVMKGGSRGLVLPDSWEARHGPILICEGLSDAIALTAMELPAIGRPSSTGGLNMLAEVLKDIKLAREVIVLGEHDEKPDGRWPGRDGAKSLANKLASLLGRSVSWGLPPEKTKDVREWCAAQGLGPDSHADEWSDAGDKFLGLLELVPVEHQPKPRRFPLTASREFLRADYSQRWLIRQVLAADEPCMLAGPKKSLKTSLLVDLVISLGTRTPWLGKFHVDRKVPVAFFSGESGPGTLQETALRVCASKGVELDDVAVHWGFALPQLSEDDQLEEWRTGIEAAEAEVVVVDPLYLSLLSGPKGQTISAANLFQMGPLLKRITDVCKGIGCTLLLCHHFKQNRTDPFAEPQLDDIGFAGSQEFARQWILLGRREKYEAGTGSHALWLKVGGSAGHSGHWAVDVGEGVVDDEFQGRSWEVRVLSASEERLQRKALEINRKAQQQHEKDDAAKSKVLEALDRLDPTGNCGAVKSWIADRAGMDVRQIGRILGLLEQDELIESCQVKTTIGHGANRSLKGYRRTSAGACLN